MSHITTGLKYLSNGSKRNLFVVSIMDLQVIMYVRPTLMGTKTYTKMDQIRFFEFFHSYGYENGPDSYGQIRLSFCNRTTNGFGAQIRLLQ